MLGKFDAGKTTYWTTAMHQINKSVVGKRLRELDANDRKTQKQNVKKIKKGLSVGNTRLVNKTEFCIEHKKGLMSWETNPEWPTFVLSDTPGGLTEEAFMSNVASADITENLGNFNELFKSYSEGDAEDTAPAGVILLFSCADFLGTMRDEEKLQQMTDQLNTLVDTAGHLQQTQGIVTYIVFSMHDRVHDTIKSKVAEIISQRDPSMQYAFVNSTDVKGEEDDWACGKTFVYVLREILSQDGMPDVI